MKKLLFVALFLVIFQQIKSEDIKTDKKDKIVTDECGGCPKDQSCEVISIVMTAGEKHARYQCVTK